jgi:hypothetical protein
VLAPDENDGFARSGEDRSEPDQRRCPETEAAKDNQRDDRSREERVRRNELKKRDKRFTMLLLSDLETGLIEVDAAYRLPVTGKAREKLRDRHVQLSERDLTYCYVNALGNLRAKVEAGKFRPNGSLFALLCTITYRRAWDLVRKTRGGTKELSWEIAKGEEIPERRNEATEMQQLKELWEAIKQFLGTLKMPSQVVLKLDIELFDREFCWVTPEELTEEVNNHFAANWSVARIKAIRHRARESLRCFLRKRGFNG